MIDRNDLHRGDMCHVVMDEAVVLAVEGSALVTVVVVRLLVLRVFTTGNVRENAEATTKFVVATPKVCISLNLVATGK